jgi:hypothetical protein
MLFVKKMTYISVLLICVLLFTPSCTDKHEKIEDAYSTGHAKEKSTDINEGDPQLSENRITEIFNKQMQISSDNGLRLRETPGLGGKKISVLGYRTKVDVLKKTIEKVTIDGIDGYWVFIKTDDGLEGWVFDGYLAELSKSLYPVDFNLTGRWYEGPANGKISTEEDRLSFWEAAGMIGYEFDAGGTFGSGKFNTGAWSYGSWTLDEDGSLNLTYEGSVLDVYGEQDPDYEYPVTTYTNHLDVIDKYHIKLTSNKAVFYYTKTTDEE